MIDKEKVLRAIDIAERIGDSCMVTASTGGSATSISVWGENGAERVLKVADRIKRCPDEYGNIRGKAEVNGIAISIPYMAKCEYVCPDGDITKE